MSGEKQVTTANLDDDQNSAPPRFMLFALLRENLATTDAVTPPPDGGLQAWTQVAMAHLILFCTWGFINSFGFFQAYYEVTMRVSGSRISWVASIQAFLLSFIGSFSGRLMDAGYYRYCLIGGFILQIIGIFMVSLCKQYWQVFLAQGLCCGIGDGLLFCPTTALIATYFVKRRAIALGLSLSGSSTGGLIFPIMVQQLLPKIGFAWTVRCMGFVVLFCSIVCLSLARPRLPRRVSGPLVEPSAFRELPYSLFVVGIFLTLWAVYFSYFYINSYALDVIGTSNSDSLSMLYIINGMGIPGRIVPTLAADRYFGGILNTYVVLGIIAGVLLYCWMAVKSYGGVIAFVICYGLIGGGVQGTALSSLPMLTTDLSKMGVRSGMVLSIVAFACLTGPPLAGALIQRDDGSYTYACAWGGTSLILGSLFVIAARWAMLHRPQTSHPRVVTALRSAREAFTTSNPKSLLAYSEASRYFPAGNTRTLLHSLPFPSTFQAAHSCYLTSLDDATHIDFCSEYTSSLFGHSHPVIETAIEAVLSTGWNCGGLSDRER
ncbi:monocarboxylate permease, putative [Talaromyces stipitatus ATCC 10500]|uniref:Monocarboxylate permease, putative n=1 Tax=Talaromyces stipitatus (strain ATCC 10500 / CBS 375.48 / QM 6759 / NRRL 1006) TaxID=441959 RepID=B8M2V0_TALSN|nr:monocarboxylate permease, putative [Talaromyces stipitatus ATCC 10500]EED22205.1 monocarboxylate permease, putative [Talaromyces stipitatus ATCC 10500]